MLRVGSMRRRCKAVMVGFYIPRSLPCTRKPHEFTLHRLMLTERRTLASVPIPKFLCTFCVCVECAAAEAFDGCEDVIGGFCPAERLGRGISDFDIGGDRGFQFGYRSLGAGPDSLLGAKR